jgi:hypothetical protein
MVLCSQRQEGALKERALGRTREPERSRVLRRKVFWTYSYSVLRLDVNSSVACDSPHSPPHLAGNKTTLLSEGMRKNSGDDSSSSNTSSKDRK